LLDTKEVFRPKGMWRRTYARLHETAFEAETRANQALLSRAERLLAKIDRPKPKGFWR